MPLAATCNNVIGEILPREDRYGVLHLPRTREDQLNRGEVMKLRVVEVGPRAYGIKIGMILHADPIPVREDGLTFEYEGREYAPVLRPR